MPLRHRHVVSAGSALLALVVLALAALPATGEEPAELIWTWSFPPPSGTNNDVETVLGAPDIDGDGVADALAACEDNTVRALSGKPAAAAPEIIWTFGGDDEKPFDDRTLHLAPDTNGDGLPDVVAGSWDGNVRALDGASVGEIETPLWEHRLDAFLDDVTRTVRVPDLDGDCVDDVAIGSFANSVRILSGFDGQPLWTPLTLGGSLTQAVVLSSIPDVTGDHQWDLAVGTWNPGTVVMVDGATGARLWQWNATDNIASVAWIGDVDGDGLPDVLAGEMDTASAHALSGRTTGCVRPGSEVDDLQVLERSTDRLELQWTPYAGPCFESYRVYGVPQDAGGCYARVVDITDQDEDGSATNESWIGPGSYLGYLVVARAPSGGLGPLGHFRR
jgi:hypothetical protein